VNGAPAALQSREPASAAAEVKSLHPHHVVADFVSFATAFSYAPQKTAALRILSAGRPFLPLSFFCFYMYGPPTGPSLPRGPGRAFGPAIYIK